MSKREKIGILLIILIFVGILLYSLISIFLFPSYQVPIEKPEQIYKENVINLPEPKIKGEMSVEEALAKRRSIREYTPEPLNLEQVSQLLWAAQGITEPRLGFRTAPSAGATYPLEIYLVVGENGVKELEAGIYKYNPREHNIVLLLKGDFRKELMGAGLGQTWIGEAPINIVIVAIYERTTARYGERGIRYVHMEAGHVGQNIYLQATALKLGTVVIGAFYDEEVQKVLNLPKEEKPLYIMPVGYPRK
ncbi:MAG: SagB/ThcOx family dehydrogenase [Nitrososphaerota archaeon]